MSTGLRTFRCRTFQSRTFRPRTLAGQAGTGVIIRFRIKLEGTSLERLRLEGTSLERLALKGN